MAITRDEMDRKLDEHFRFEAEDNVEGVLATLTPEVEHDIVGWPPGPTLGRANARPFYEALFADLSEGQVRSLRRLYGDNFMVDESMWWGKAPGKPFGLDGRDRPQIPAVARHRVHGPRGDQARERLDRPRSDYSTSYRKTDRGSRNE